LFTGAVALVTGALGPTKQASLGSRIGNTDLRFDLHGDALGAAKLPGDPWRMAHGAFKHQIFLDAKYLGVAFRKEVYGLFTRFFDLE
jgi:hypothetical protein